MVSSATVVTAVTVLVMMLDCGSDSAATNLTGEERRELERRLDAAEAEVGFDVKVPTYVPQGLERVPEIDTQHSDEPTLVYRRSTGDTTSAQPQLAGVLVFELHEPVADYQCLADETTLALSSST